jgi:hypothetical protein
MQSSGLQSIHQCATGLPYRGARVNPDRRRQRWQRRLLSVSIKKWNREQISIYRIEAAN